MIKTAAIPMDKEIQSFQFIFTGQQYKIYSALVKNKSSSTFDFTTKNEMQQEAFRIHSRLQFNESSSITI